MKSLLDVSKYAEPPQENIMLCGEYWPDNDEDFESEDFFEDDEIDEF